jgi:NAD+ synthase (glutamine-hydrolysing)
MCMTVIAPKTPQPYTLTVNYTASPTVSKAEARGFGPVDRLRFEQHNYRFTGMFAPPAPGRAQLPYDGSGATQPVVAHGQIDVRPGNPRANVAAMIKAIKEAKAAGADVIAFPEMAVGGYTVGDDWVHDSYCEELMIYNEQLKAASQGITVVWGNVYLDTPKRMAQRGIDGYHPNEDGGTRRYNAIFVAQNGEWAPRLNDPGILPPGVMSKTLLPNYRYFDDKRYFHSTIQTAQDFGIPLQRIMQPFVIEVGGKRIPVGVQCCEDLWCEEYRWNGQALNPTKMTIENGAVAMINISTSPGETAPGADNKPERRDARVMFLKKECGDTFVPFHYINTVGVQNNGKNLITFDGGSTSYGRDGKPVAFANQSHNPEIMIVRPEMTTPLVRPSKRVVEAKYEQILSAIQSMGTDRRWLVGMSGGVDSAVAAALIAKSVGEEHVRTVNMPTVHNGTASRTRAREASERLGIEHIEESIQPVVDIVKQVTDRVRFSDSRPRSELNDENIQAKVRGTDFLSNIASRDGFFFSNNGNKLELALGYATLYGDWGGALGILGDLYKPEVWEMARYLNEKYGKEVVPASLIPDHFGRFAKDGAPPSAELKNAQIDPMKFYYHDAILDLMIGPAKATAADIMHWYMDGSLAKRLEKPIAQMGVPVENYPNYGERLLERWGLTDPKTFIDDLKWFTSMFQNAVFKRVQSPPVIVTGHASFGFDYRESIKSFVWDSDTNKALVAAVLAEPPPAAE